MSKRKGAAGVGRRGFLKGATIAGAAALAPLDAIAQTQAPPAPAKPAVARPNVAAETQIPPAEAQLTEATSGSDFMVDCIKSLGFEYLPSNPASSFRGLQESVINYGNNSAPEFLMCTHEEIAASMAHGYAKIEGKPLITFAHGTVGLHHASMALYNAWCDRVPVYMIIGNGADMAMRRPGVEWAHTAQDAAAMVRDFTKFDDYPASLQHFAESSVRAYKIATTPPMGPVVLVADGGLQEDPIPEDAQLSIPKLPRIAIAQGDSGAVAETAKLLVEAQNPVLMADRGFDSASTIKHLVELAEILQCAVIDAGSRMNFPTRHPLNQSARGRAVLTQADVVVGFDMFDFWGQVHSYRDQLHRTSKSILKPGTKTITISAGDLYGKSNYQDFERFPDVDLAIGADGTATLPVLVEAVKKLVTDDRKSAYEQRGKKFAAASAAAYQQAKEDAAYGWDASPISTARVCAELWAQIKNEDWSLVTSDNGMSGWAHRLWTMEKPYHFIGDSGGYGQGYGPGGSVGAALANRKYGRLTVSLQGDGDFMYTPGALWTAAKYKIPILMIIHNNHAYHQEVMHVQRMADRHMRGVGTALVGTGISNPNIDYAKLAQSMGMHGEGPITDPSKLGPALQRAIAIVKTGEPVLLDVSTQPR